MATDLWNGNGDWTGTPGDWSAGTPPGTADDAIIETGTDTLSTSASVDDVTIIANAALNLGNGASLTTTGSLVDYGTLNITGNGDTVHIGGVLNTRGTTSIGGTGLGASTAVTAAGLQTSGTLVLQGNAAFTTSSQATLSISGATSAILSGTVKVLGDADLALATGITTIAQGALLQIDGANARVSLGAGTANSALTGLATIAGTLVVDGGNGNGAGGALVTTNTGMANSGSLQVDLSGGDGASTLTLGGALTNSGTVQIGNAALGANASATVTTTVTAAGLVNTGSLTLQGNNAANATSVAVLNVTAASSATATGATAVAGDADLALTTGITAIGSGATLELDGAQARVSLGRGTGNTGLTGLSTIAGTFRLRGATGNGAGGTTVTTNTDLTNVGTVQIDAYGGGDGGSTFSIGGVLSNAGAFAVGNNGLSAATSVTAAGLVNTGSLYVEGSNGTGATSHLATLGITGATAGTSTGLVLIGGDADLALTTGIATVGAGATLEIDGFQAHVSLGAGTSNNALSGLASNAGTFRLRGDTGYGTGGTVVTTSTGFNNTANLQVDSYGNGDGGSTVTIGGVLTNSGTTGIGNNALSANTTVTASGLANTGAINLYGSNGFGNANYRATLAITGATPATTTGIIVVGGDADLALTTGITAIGSGATLEIDGQQARVSLGTGTGNSALTGLTSNAGILRLRGGTGNGASGTSITTTTAFKNTGSLQVESYGNGDGGSTLTLGGKLTNSGTVGVGNNALSASTTLTTTGLTNTGTISLEGSNNGALNNPLATLQVTGATQGTTTGFMLVGGEADLALATGITGVGAGSTLEIDGSQARVSLGLGSSNSALTALSTNAGTLRLRGNTGIGLGGTTITTTKLFNNTGALQVDSYGNGDGGSSLSIANKLTNSNALSIGNNVLNGTTTVTAGSFVNTGSLILFGNNGATTTNQATLQIMGASAATVAGFMLVGGDADLALNTAITAVGSGSTLEIDGAKARVSLGLDTANSALTGLASNAGILRLRGDTGIGNGGTSVTTSTGLNNTGALSVDSYGNGDGASTLTVGGTLTNAGSLGIGNNYLSGLTTVTAAALNSTGSLTLLGNNAASTNYLATLNITGSNSGTVSGYVLVGGDADLALASGITAIAASATLEVDGALARVSLGTGTGNSGLAALATNAGTFRLRGDTGLGANGTTVTTTKLFNNTGTVSIDSYSNGDGGSILAIGNGLTNSGTISVGNYYASAATTLSAASLTNSGTFTLSDNATTHLDQFSSAGAATNTGNLTVGIGSQLVLGSGKTYAQQGGTTTVAGLLTAASVVDSGGLLDFKSTLAAGNGTGAIQLSGGATLQFDAAVDASHLITFTGDSGGTMNLTAPGSFGGTIAGFSGGDAIDLVNTAVTGLSYAGNGASGTLTVTGASGAVATLAFQGSYQTASFTAVSDGHNGTLILDPKAA